MLMPNPGVSLIAGVDFRNGSVLLSKKSKKPRLLASRDMLFERPVYNY